MAHSLGTLGLPEPEAPGHPFGLFSDFFGVPGPEGPGGLCARPGGSQGKITQCNVGQNEANHEELHMNEVTL